MEWNDDLGLEDICYYIDDCLITANSIIGDGINKGDEGLKEVDLGHHIFKENLAMLYSKFDSWVGIIEIPTPQDAATS